MSDQIEARLTELGLVLPPAAAPVANYLPYLFSGSLLFISGQISMADGRLITGKVGQDLSVEAGAEAAKQCGLALLSQAKAALNGELERVQRLVKITGFVNSGPEFGEQPEVINGVSDLMVAVLGERGQHTRAAVSAASLPRNVAVEVDAIFEVK